MRRSTRPTIVPGPSLPTPAAELVVAVTSGRATAKSPDEQTTKHGPTVAELARDWQEVNQPRQQRKTAEWVGWSPKTAVTVADNFRIHILPAIGTYLADQVTGLHLDRLYRSMQVRNGLSASAVLRCHAQDPPSKLFARRRRTYRRRAGVLGTARPGHLGLRARWAEAGDRLGCREVHWPPIAEATLSSIYIAAALLQALCYTYLQCLTM